MRRAPPGPLRPRHHRATRLRRMTGTPGNDTPLRKTHPQTVSTGTREPLARGGQGGRLLHVTRRERQVWALIFIALAAFLSGGNRLMSKRPQTARPVDSPRLTDCYRGEGPRTEERRERKQ